MRRRDFVKAAAASVVTWPFAARAQQPARPVIGFLRSASLDNAAPLVIAFQQGLREIGYVDGQNVTIEVRSAENDRDKLTALVNDFTRRPVDVIVGNVVAAVAAKAATKTVPIVFATGSDPVNDGLVTSLNRPGGNVTGVSFFAAVLGRKRLELLREVVPPARIIAVLVGPDSSDTIAERRDVEAAAKAIGQQIIVVKVASDGEIDTAFANFVQRGAGALLVGTGAFMNSHLQQVVGLAARNALPASYFLRETVAAGGLMSYGASITDAYRQVGIYAGRVLKGEKPGDLPVMQSTKFEFVINLKTAKALGLSIPPTLLALADEVIE